MKHSEVLFNIDLYELTYNDLEVFFQTQKDESLNLEFKSYVAVGNHNSKEDTVKKAVCGLLNSEGGIVIWGAPIEVTDAQGKKSAVGALTPFQTNLDRDRLINIFSSSISPMPIGIRVQALQNPEGLSIFIIEVEKSIERPHQYDDRYYVRLDGQTRKAPHYLISALMKSVNYPILNGHLRLKNIASNGHNFSLRFRQVLVNSSQFINDINVSTQTVASPGHIFLDNINQGGRFSQTYPILSNGAPLSRDFVLVIPVEQMNQDINIGFQFGGEKSPSKISNYTYRFPGNIIGGNIADKNLYLFEKSENQFPNNSAEEIIDMLLDA